MTIPLKLTKIKLPTDNVLAIVVNLYYKEYYAANYTLLASNVPVDADGTIQVSPHIQFLVDPTHDYMVRADNLLCDAVYEQEIFINPYCPISYELSEDSTYCFKDEITAAIPPTNPQISVDKSDSAYGTCGTYIYNSGYNLNGTGTSTHINTANTFWTNGLGNCVDSGTVNGPVNRAALWATTTTNNQDIGFSVCITISETKTYYVGIACDNFGFIDLDGVNIITQNEVALEAQYSVTGICFKAFHVYPVVIPAGNHTLTCSGHNVSGAAGLAVEIYNNTSAQIIAATDYTGLNLVFSSKDFIGMPIQIGSGGVGYSCEDGDAFVSYCDSPIVCKKRIITNVKY